MTAKTNAALKAQMIDRQPLTKAMLDDLVDSKPGQSGALIDADIPAAIARDAEVTSAIAAHVTALHSYKVYTALLTQTGTNAPVATVLQNTLGGTVVWSYIGAGVYQATLAGAFTLHKTTVHVDPYVQTSPLAVAGGFAQGDTNSVLIYIVGIAEGGDALLNPLDDLLGESMIEIRIYP